MSPDDTGINKPFDRVLKSFADEAPELLLRLLGLAPPGIEVKIQPLRPETAPTVVLPDFAAMVTIDVDRPFIVHAEFLTAYRSDVPRDMARYGGSLAWQYQKPVWSVLVLLRPEGVPAVVPEMGEYTIGETVTRHPFKVIRLWELDPTPVLETKQARLLPWAVLMKSSDAQVRQIASLLAKGKDEEALGRFLVLGSIRYDRGTLTEMIGARNMGIVEAILEASRLAQEERAEARGLAAGLAAGLAKGKVEGKVEGKIEGRAEGKVEGRAEGKVEGRAEGKVEGRAEEARRFLQRLLRKHLPELESMPQIEAITDPDVLESIIDNVIDATSAADIRAAILRHAENR